jgi:PIN domain nuclease of toxin-antitoxin system
MTRVQDAPGTYDPQSKPVILLDTCVLLWIALGELDRLGKHARRALERHRWAVSALTPWEIAIKHALGNIHLPQPPATWWPAASAHFCLEELAFTADIGLAAGALPLHHKDPFDRGIIATAQVRSLLLVSPDPHIAAYRGIIGVIW